MILYRNVSYSKQIHKQLVIYESIIVIFVDDAVIFPFVFSLSEWELTWLLI